MIFISLSIILLQTLYIPFIHQPEPQSEKTRTYRDFSFDLVKTIQSDSIYRPGIIRLVNDAIYILDYSPHARVLNRALRASPRSLRETTRQEIRITDIIPRIRYYSLSPLARTRRGPPTQRSTPI